MAEPGTASGADQSAGALAIIDPADAWITSPQYISGPADTDLAPLPDASEATIEQPIVEVDAALIRDEDMPGYVAPAKDDKKEKVVAKKEGEGDEKVEVADPDLSEAENKMLAAVDEAERPAAKAKFKRLHFEDHYLNLDKPIGEVRTYLKERSGVRYNELEGDIVKDLLAKPDEFCATTYKRDPKTYAALATAVVLGDPATSAAILTGSTKPVDPATLKTALAFYEANKDRVFENSDKDLAVLDDDMMTEMTRYLPDATPAVRAALEKAQRAQSLESENSTLKSELASAKAAPKEAAAGEDAAAVAEQKEQELWDLGRDTVTNFVFKLAADPIKGAGIVVTPEERKKSPLVARLKDLKANVLFDGINEGDKPLLTSFQQGFTEWADNRKGFKEKMLHTLRFVKAGEKHNVVEVAESLFPLAQTYYEDRLKHPIFKELDALIEIVSKKSAEAPKRDVHIPGRLPAAKGAGTAQPESLSGHSDAYLIADAVRRSAPG